MRQGQALTVGSSGSDKMRHAKRSKIRINCSRQLYAIRLRETKHKIMQRDDILYTLVPFKYTCDYKQLAIKIKKKKK